MSSPVYPVKILYDTNNNPSGFGEFVLGEDHIPSGILQLSSLLAIENLSSLGDVSSYQDAITGYVLTLSGNTWIASSVTGGGGATSLSALSDVSSYPDAVTGYVLTLSGNTWIASANIGSGGGVTDHGALTGLSDDDHTQYLLVNGTRAMTGNLNMGNLQIVNVSGVDGRDIAVDGAKLDGIESGATADLTGSEIKALYEAEPNTNAFTDSEKTKLGSVETGATADQSDAEIEAAYNNQVPQVSTAERTAGTENAVRRFSPADVSSMVFQHQTPFPPIGTSALSGLSDVSSSIIPINHQVLVWSSTEWTASTITHPSFPTIGTSALSGLSDVSTFPDITDGQPLRWRASDERWIASSIIQTKTWMVSGEPAISGNDDFDLMYAHRDITIQKVISTVAGDTTPSGAFNIYHSSDRSDVSPNQLFSSDQGVASTTIGNEYTSFNDATIPAGSFVWVISSNTQGNIWRWAGTVLYTED